MERREAEACGAKLVKRRGGWEMEKGRSVDSGLVTRRYREGWDCGAVCGDRMGV